ncbi:MAG: hypothetical protein ACPGU1_02490 [Myxococcota bacterium]
MTQYRASTLVDDESGKRLTGEDDMATENGLKKVWSETKTTVQARFKEAEQIWSDAFAQVNTRLQGAEKDARDFVKRVEEDGLVRLQGLGKQLNMDDLVGKLKVSELTEQVGRITKETIDKLGLVNSEELSALRDELATVTAELATLKEIKTKANGAATKSTVTKLTKRVAALEKKAKKA